MGCEEKLSGILELILPEDPLSDQIAYAFLRVPYKNSLVTICGNHSLSLFKIGSSVDLTGHWSVDASGALVFRFTAATTYNPASAIMAYLTAQIKGVGPKLAQKIVSTFGEETLFVLDSSPSKLVEVDGISPTRCEDFSRQLQEQKDLRNALLFLQRHGIAIHYGLRLYKKYQNQTIDKVCQDPFLLAKEMYGVGFKTADLIATCLGVPLNSPNRIVAGIQYSLDELQEEGHTCYPLNEFIVLVEKLLNEDTPEKIVRKEEIRTQIHFLARQKAVYVKELEQDSYIWSRQLFLAEQQIAIDIRRLLFSSKRIRSINTQEAILEVENLLDLKLEEKQKEALHASSSQKIHIISGGPGTGKSTITRAILSIFEKISSPKKIILAAPTGKAAKRMTEITGKRTQTIHSLLQYDFKTLSFRKNHADPIDCDLVIVDESGMIDTILLQRFLAALPDHAILILIGDVHQLPSVGPGNVLKDLILSHHIEVTYLTKIFRQLQNSNIITNAHKVNQGEFPILNSSCGKKDFLFFQKEDPEDAIKHIIHLVSDFVPKKFGIFTKDIQVLAPMKKGVLGIRNLNRELKAALNPNKPFIQGKFHSFSTGDRVMQTRNNYNKEVFNGDIGYIASIDLSKKSLVACVDGRYIGYSQTELNDLTPAYATSIHKYQGSETACIIVPIHTSHYVMLYRNLLYTAITRGKKLVILVGTKKAVAIAVRNDKVQHRCTGLQQAMHALLSKPQPFSSYTIGCPSLSPLKEGL
ncbi:MAG: ATP-dependent RecD-like DNA helicase [Chlamydia suis]|uniref:SF1B family DNA helicase RecD2 n=1 Tax=Chlamydia suis TaxID=83559 RepID=UPI0003BFF827|nr:ATP-dependent RecD-like DNA helicase [Chlamydia suis]ESN89801.1 exodeoxyribonuclease V, Alpha [Chlamydia suis MD56]MDD6310147.1 ATP-dependent RecD-like DNA helicase [Chlamydia suis]SIU03055.1 exodeoxyribonuclease V subunit alpha,Exodeoxyribonuclease V alpha chain,exonuclease V subunit alpha,helicase, RecD/TraA family,Viral (Superfamily 1) RNA helicase [Chlamydia suis]